MQKKWIIVIICMAVILMAVAAYSLWSSRVENWDYGFAREVSQEEEALRLSVVQEAEKWLGSHEGTQEHKEILRIYNTFEPLAQGYTVKEDDNWCATFVSTVAITCHLTDTIPTECGCQRQIGLFNDLGCWNEADDYIPLPGDIIYYCSDDKNPLSDCTGWSDHVGIVVGTCNDYIKVIEGNYNNTVAYRYIKVNSTGIRGFATPDYAAALQTLDPV